MIHQSPYPPLRVPNVPVHELVLAALEARGSAVALIDAIGGREWTAADVVDRTRRLASGLARRGVGRGDTVAVVSPNVLEYSAALLGISLTGAIATTINPLGTADDFAYQFGETKPKLVITVPAMLERVQAGASRATDPPVFVIGDPPGVRGFSELLDPDPAPVVVAMDPATDLVAMPWSSGTSGRPKAVMLTHRNLLAQLHQVAIAHAIEAGQPMIAVLPFFHIYGLVLILYAALWRGVPLVVLPRFELETFLSTVERYRVAYLPIVPPIVVALTKQPIVDRFDLRSVRYVMSGAAPLGSEVERACGERLRCLVLQGYGMTELTGASHLYPLDPSVIRTGAVGWLAPGMEARIVDVETGADQTGQGRGELWLRGPNVMRGYFNRPEETARTLDAEGWLHTGDVAYVDPEGNWYIVDRVKELIKYKGHQVAPADLEAVLLSHPGIADAAVIPSPDPDCGEVPKAFVVLKAPLEPEAIMAWVAERVAPADKVRRVAIVESIPKSPSGKILRRVLVEQERAAAAP